MNELAWASNQQLLNIRYNKYNAYYNGIQPLDFVSRHTKSVFGNLFADFSDNLCKPICNVFANRLKLNSVDSSNETIDILLADIFNANKLKLQSNILHSDAIKLGDAYCMVWLDDNQNVVIKPQRTNSIFVRYEDSENSECIVEALKVWNVKINDKTCLRINRYLPDRIEKYITASKQIPKAINQLDYFSADGEPVIANPYNQIPIFHFSNSSDYLNFGSSEIKDIIPLQNALNKAVIDMLVGMEFAALPQRYATGIELETDSDGNQINNFKASIDRLWISGNDDTKFGQFDATDLTQFLKIQDNIRQEICAISNTPAHLILPNNNNFPSGEALKVAEAVLTTKVLDKQEVWGDVWASVFKFACKLKNVTSDDINVNWIDTKPNNEKQNLENAINKKLLGVSTNQILGELGYSTSQIDAFTLDNAVSDTNSIVGFNK